MKSNTSTKLSHFLFMIVICGLFAACKHHDEPLAPRHLLTIDASNQPALATGDNWFFISDKAGHVLGVERDSLQEMLTIDGITADDSLSLTWMRNTGTLAAPLLTITTYGAIPAGSTFSMVSSSPLPLASRGQFHFTLTDIVSPSVAKSISISATSTSYAAAQVSTPFAFDFNLFADTTSVFVSGFTPDGGPVYKAFHHIGDGDQVSLDYADMTPFANTVSLPGSTRSADLSGYKVGSQEKVILGSILNFPDGAYTKKIGYLSGFDKLILIVNGPATSDFSIAYFKTASTLGTFTFPSVQATKTDLSIQHGKLQVNRQASTKQMFFSYRAAANRQYEWSIFSPFNYQVNLMEIPSDLTAIYPELQFSNFSFSNATIIEQLSPWSYSDFLKRLFESDTISDSEGFYYLIY